METVMRKYTRTSIEKYSEKTDTALASEKKRYMRSTETIRRSWRRTWSRVGYADGEAD